MDALFSRSVSTYEAKDRSYVFVVGVISFHSFTFHVLFFPPDTLDERS